MLECSSCMCWSLALHVQELQLTQCLEMPDASLTQLCHLKYFGPQNFHIAYAKNSHTYCTCNFWKINIYLCMWKYTELEPDGLEFCFSFHFASASRIVFQSSRCWVFEGDLHSQNVAFCQAKEFSFFCWGFILPNVHKQRPHLLFYFNLFCIFLVWWCARIWMMQNKPYLVECTLALKKKKEKLQPKGKNSEHIFITLQWSLYIQELKTELENNS